MGTLDRRGELDPAAAAVILCVGRKGSGKSLLANLLAMSWPYDMVIIDVAGDDGPRARVGRGTHDVFTVTGTVDTLPRRWPETWRRDGRPMILRYLPDPGSPTELEDMDAMAGLAMAHSGRPKPALLLIHEIGRAAPVGRTPPHMRRVLQHGRHEKLTVIAAGPRPMTIDPLVASQADLIYIFDVPNPADRRRLADAIGWPPRELDAAVADLRHHEYLRYDVWEDPPEHPDDADYRLVHYPPLPEDVVRDVRRWMAGI